MKIIILLVFCAFSSLSYSACKGTIERQDVFEVNDLIIIGGGVQTQVFNNPFVDSTCEDSDNIKKLDIADYIIGMGEGDSVRLKVSVKWNASNSISLSKKNGAFSGGYTVSIQELSSPGSVDVSANGGYSVTLNNVAVMTGATIWSSGDAFVQWLVCAIDPKNWGTCINTILNKLNGKGLYSTHLTISYNKKVTTCIPGNLSITLNAIAMNELKGAGEVNTPSQRGDITLECKDGIGLSSLASRDVLVSLHSGLVWDGNKSVLKSNSDNGVGFVLRDGITNGLIHINQGSETGSVLKKFSKGKLINNIETIPLIVRYYVFDINKVKPGELQSNALIVVSYN
ncbi:fimbrial protein [Citrobacter freundii]|uniref:fimbrial protein n=1 Tax=Citrobacter freundii TaxID=546 RepID=UPI00383B689D